MLNAAKAIAAMKRKSSPPFKNRLASMGAVVNTIIIVSGSADAWAGFNV